MSINYGSIISLNKRTSIVLIFIFIAIILLDSTIVVFYSYSGVQVPSSLNKAIFIAFSAIFVASSLSLLNTVRRRTPRESYKSGRLSVRHFRDIIITATQL